MTATVSVLAAALVKGDVFAYSDGMVTVHQVTPLGETHVEVNGFHEWHGFTSEKWIDYSLTEAVNVSAGPSFETAQAMAKVAAPLSLAPSATVLAMQHVRRGALRSLPASAVGVLYAVAAVQAEDPQHGGTTGNVAHAAGLTEGTVAGHLRNLERLGLVQSQGGLRTWTVRPLQRG